MARETSSGSNSFVVKNIQNVHHMKIDMVKFSGTNNFELWRCEVMDAQNTQNLEDTLKFQERPVKIEEKVWKKMNWTTCGMIRPYLEQYLKYDMMNVTSVKKIREILASKYLTKSIENHLHLKRNFTIFS